MAKQDKRTFFVIRTTAGSLRILNDLQISDEVEPGGVEVGKFDKYADAVNHANELNSKPVS